MRIVTGFLIPTSEWPVAQCGLKLIFALSPSWFGIRDCCSLFCGHAISYTREDPGKSGRHSKSEHPNKTAQQTKPFTHHSWSGYAAHPAGSVPDWKLEQHLLLKCLLEVNFVVFYNWCACLWEEKVSGCEKVLGQWWSLAWKRAPSLRSWCYIQTHGNTAEGTTTSTEDMQKSLHGYHNPTQGKFAVDRCNWMCF